MNSLFKLIGDKCCYPLFCNIILRYNKGDTTIVSDSVRLVPGNIRGENAIHQRDAIFMFFICVNVVV